MAADYLAVVKEALPEGPYVLGGFCFGGLVAFEMARQLEARNEVVRDVILMDCAGTNGPLSKAADWIDRLAAVFHLGVDRRLAVIGALARLARRIWNYRPRRIIARVRQLAADPERGLLRGFWSHLTGLFGSVAPTVKLQEDPTMDMTVVAGAKYIPRRYRGHISVLYQSCATAAAVDGWHAVSDRIDVHRLRGDHVTCITRYAAETSAVLRECLIAAEAR